MEIVRDCTLFRNMTRMNIYWWAC